MLQIGEVLDNTYEIQDRIGSGGGGIIFKAYHKRMKKTVAIKLIKEDVKGLLENRSEVDILKNLKNEYLPQVLDFISSENNVYTVMEFVEGSNFQQLIRCGKRFSEKKVKKYALQLCNALEYLHNQNPPIIHSDIKPSNIMLTPSDNICLIDFNISTLSSEKGALSIGGSKGFAAPEQYKKIVKNIPVTDDGFHEEARFLTDDETELLVNVNESIQLSFYTAKTKNINCAYIDIRSDIYGMGASLYYIATGRTPNAERLDFNGTKLSSGLRRIITKSMSPDPDKRYKNITELKNALERYDSPIKIILPTVSVALIGTMVIVASNNVVSLNNNKKSTKLSTTNVTDDLSVTTTAILEETEATTVAEVSTKVVDNTTLSETSITTIDSEKVIPKLVGFTLDDAVAICKSLNISAIITYVESDTATEKTIISQSVVPGTKISEIASLEIAVCKEKSFVIETTTEIDATTRIEPIVTYSTSSDPDSGWQYDDLGYYYIDENGLILTGFSIINNGYYYFDEDGYAISGFYSPYSTTYYLTEKGKITYNFQIIDDYLYYFGLDGEMRTGWREIDGKIYYFSDDGRALTGKHVINSESFEFSDKGVLKSTNKPENDYVEFEYTDKWFHTWREKYDDNNDINDELSSMYHRGEISYFTYLYFYDIVNIP